MSFNELTNHFVGIRGEQIFFTYNCCGSCGLLYCPVFFSQYALNRLYESMPDNTSVAGREATRQTQAGYAQLFSKVGPNSTLLDIGSDIGLLGEELQRRGLRQISCVEPNKKVWGEIERRLGDEAKIYSDLDDVPTASSFSEISAIHLVDYLLEPKIFLQNLVSKSMESGELLIVVHDEKSLLRKLMGVRWPPYCLQHPQLFNKKTLTSLLNHAGWRIEQQGRTTNFFSLTTVLSHLRTIVSGQEKNVKASSVGEVIFPLKTGNFYTVCSPA